MSDDSTITLGAMLDLTQAEPLKAQLLAVGGPVTVDAGQVQRIGTPCLQVLAAVARGPGLRITAMSDAFAQTVTVLGLSHIFGESHV